MTDARQWIGALGGRLIVQARLLDSLLGAVEADDRWEWLELSCSVASGRGDELSEGSARDEPRPPKRCADDPGRIGVESE
jgi:hypothetical protein